MPANTQEHLNLIDELSRRYENDDTRCKEAALLNLRLDLPAYWSRSTHANVLACAVHLDANRFGPVNAVHKHARPDWPSYAAHRPYLLSTLIPLNDEATEELKRAVAVDHFEDVK